MLLSNAFAMDATKTPQVDRTFIERVGRLPSPGSLQDVLTCAGANEVVWTDTSRADPYSRVAKEAKLKASWYAAVALYVFAVDSKAIVDAVEAAKRTNPRAQVMDLARSCRAAPESWRD
jgi:hypothetical protein